MAQESLFPRTAKQIENFKAERTGELMVERLKKEARLARLGLIEADHEALQVPYFNRILRLAADQLKEASRSSVVLALSRISDPYGQSWHFDVAPKKVELSLIWDIVPYGPYALSWKEVKMGIRRDEKNNLVGLLFNRKIASGLSREEMLKAVDEAVSSPMITEKLVADGRPYLQQDSVFGKEIIYQSGQNLPKNAPDDWTG